MPNDFVYVIAENVGYDPADPGDWLSVPDNVKDALDELASRVSSVVNDKHFSFTQAVAATTWTIAHNLGKFPSPIIVDTGGTEVEGEIRHIDQNNLEIKFNAAFSGVAYMN